MRTFKEIIPTTISQEEFILKCSLDPAYFTEHVMGLEVMPFHKEWFEAVREHQRVCIIAPRETGKTTMLGVAYPLWLAFFFQNKSILIVSSSLENSTKVLEQIKSAITENEMLSALIPQFKQLAWSKTEINTSTRCKVYCKPYTQNIRGAHVNYVLCDEASLFNDKNIFYNVISPVVNIKKGKIVLIGTPQFSTDLLMELSKNPEYHTKLYRSIRDDGEPLWPNHFSQEVLDRIKSEIGESAFAKEYLCDPSTSYDMVFDPNRVADALDKNIVFTYSGSSESEHYIGVDLGTSATASWSVITVIEKVDNRLIIRFINRMRGIAPEAQASRVIDMAKQYNARSILIDESGAGVQIINDIRKCGLKVQGQEFDSKKRMELLNILVGTLQANKLVIPYSEKDMTQKGLIDSLIKEMFGFTYEVTTTGIPTYKSHTKYDDMVISLALAVKAAESQKKFVDFMAIG